MNRFIEALAQAYVGKSQARRRYTEYAKLARKEGLELVSNVFLETADHEKTHGKNFFRMIQKVIKKLGEKTDMLEIQNVAVPIVRGTVFDQLSSMNNPQNILGTKLPTKLEDGDSCSAYIKRVDFENQSKESGYSLPTKVKAYFRTNEDIFYSDLIELSEWK